MGRDGAAGSGDVLGGGLTIAQDEQSSAVVGMPRAAAARGVEACILPGRDRRLRGPRSASGRARYVTSALGDIATLVQRETGVVLRGGGRPRSGRAPAPPRTGPREFLRAMSDPAGGALLARLIDEVTVKESSSFVTRPARPDPVACRSSTPAPRVPPPSRLDRRMRDRGGALYPRAARRGGVPVRSPPPVDVLGTDISSGSSGGRRGRPLPGARRPGARAAPAQSLLPSRA